MRSWTVVGLMLLAGCAGQTGSNGSGSFDQGLRDRARIHTELGSGYFAQGQMAIALEEFNEAVSADPSYSLSYNGLGLVYGNLHEDAKAEASFKRSIELEPNNPESHNNYGTFLCARNRIDESIMQFMEAVKNPLYASPGVAYLNAGVCSLKKQDAKNAELYFRNALQAQPNLHAAAYQLALIAFNRGDHLLARGYLLNAMADNPKPEMFWLGVRVERVLGDQDAEASYTLLLKNKYPDSEQTKALLSGQ